MSLNNLGLGFLFTAKDLASGVMHDVKGRLHELGEEGERVAKSLKESFVQFGTGVGLMAMGGELLEHLEPAVEAAYEFSQALKLVQTRVSEAEFPMAEMEEIADGLGAKFGQMPVEELKAMYDGVAAGARDAASSQALLAASNAIAVTGQMGLRESLAAVSQVAKVFNVDLRDSAQVSDALFVASKHVEGGVQGMSQMLEHLGPSAAAAGFSMNELLATIAQMEAAGIRGRPALGGLKSILDSMVQPTKDAQAEAARLGIAWDTATLQAKGLPQILADIESSGRANSQTLDKLFGSTEAATVAMGLMRNGGADLQKMLGELGGATGAAAAAADKLVTAEQRFKVLEDQTQTAIGKAILPVRKAILEMVNTVLEGFLKVNPKVTQFFTLLFAGVAIVATVVGGAMALSAALTILSGVAGVLGISFAGTAAAIWAALWPVLVIAGVLALAIWGLKVAFDKNFGGISDKAREVWDELKLVFTALDELFTGGGFTEDTWQQLEKHSGIRDFAISVFGWVSRIENFFGHIGSTFERDVSVVQPMLKMLGVAIDQVVDAFSLLSGPQGADGAADAFDTFGAAGSGVGDLLIGVFYVVLGVIQWVIAAISATVSVVVGVVDAIKAVFSGLIDFFYGFFEFFAELVQGHWGGAWHGMKMMVFGVVDAIIGVLLALVGVVGGIVDAIASAFGKKLNLQKDIGDFAKFTHNEMAKDFGVAQATGLRQVREKTPTGLGGISVGGLQPGEIPMASGTREGPRRASLLGEPAEGEPAQRGLLPGRVSAEEGGASMPAVAAATASSPASEMPGADFATMTSHLEQIAKNTEGGGPPLNVNLLMDGEVIGRAASRARRNDETRNFTPAPVPG